jgi:hypothetical protein
MSEFSAPDLILPFDSIANSNRFEQQVLGTQEELFLQLL